MLSNETYYPVCWVNRVAIQVKAKKKKKLSQAIKSTAPFYHQQLNGSGEQQSIITATPCAPARLFFPSPEDTLLLLTNRSPGKRWNFVFQKVIICLHRSSRRVAWEPSLRKLFFISNRPKKFLFPVVSDLIISFLKDASVQCVWLLRGTLGHPLKKINIWTMLLWVSMFRCIKLNGAWNWFQVLLEKVYRYSEMKPREVPQRGDDLHPADS